MKLQILLIPLWIIFLFRCSNLPQSPFNKSYTGGDYRLEIDFDAESLSCFIPYSTPYQTGSDEFSSFSIFTTPSGKVDTTFFRYKKKDSLNFYFLSPFIGSLGIIGIRPNGICDTFIFPLTVYNSFSIECNNNVAIADSLKFTLATKNTPNALDYIKRVIWYVDNLEIDTLLPTDTFNVSIAKRGTFIISARCIDWKSNSIDAKKYQLLLQNTKPQVVIRPVDKTLYVDDSIMLSINIASQKNDTGTLTIFFKGDTLKNSITFGSEDTLSLRACIGMDLKAGIEPVTLFYTNQKGVSSVHKSMLITVESRHRKNIITSAIFDPQTIYDNEAVQITIQHIHPPSGLNCNKYYWSTNGDTIWDTVTTIPVCRFKFSGDSLQLAVRCADSTGFNSDIFFINKQIHPGIPIIDTIWVSDSLLYNDKPFKINIVCRDNPGGTIDSFKISLKDSQNRSFSLLADCNPITLIPDTSFYGNIRLSAQVKDSSGHWSVPFISNTNFFIDKGYPQITSFFFPDTVWRLHPTRLKVDVSDPDGSISKIIIDWDDQCTDTFNVNNKRVSSYFNHVYKNQPEAIIRNVKIMVIDDSGFKTLDSVTVTTHDGKPKIKIIAGPDQYLKEDTLYLKESVIKGRCYDRGCKNDYRLEFVLHAEAFDSNGTILMHYADIDSPFSIVNATSSSYTGSFYINSYRYDDTSFFPGNSMKSVLFCIDNDSLVNTDTFFIKIDYKPGLVYISEPNNKDTIRGGPPYNFRWSGGIDEIDSLDASYTLKIVFKPNDTLVYNGKLKDIIDHSADNSQFKVSVEEDLRSNKEQSKIDFNLYISDRFNQTSSSWITCYKTGSMQ